ncbi:MAG: fused MFS/spermidine synthase [Pseudomonadota bacterium]|nr:fused MFS/spermidine synthase [Pseudomonadota bacterium]
MTVIAPNSAPAPSLTRPLFAATVFLSAGLTFLVQPMIARLLLPLLGGSPAVWNTSMAFFQAALLVGYAYAHGLQRLRTARAQVAVHALVLLVAAAFLPVRVWEAAGEPSAASPALWLLGALALSIGLPFAALSATAPLVQAWWARVHGAEQGGRDPYVLYAASNLGSLLGLLAYPLLVEPTLTLPQQSLLWTGGFALFAGLALLIGLQAWRSPAAQAAAGPARPAAAVAWRDRLTWLGLAAVPSSLLLGVTSHLSTDVAAAPFLWAAPLALYLLTFVNAFAARPVISRERALFWHGGLLPLALALLLTRSTHWPVLLGVGLASFFLGALVCHQTLAARRPPPERLTEFYLWLSLGGVLGGAFNAFVAPVLFHAVWEYPLALALTALARPSERAPGRPLHVAVFALGAAAVLGAAWQLRSSEPFAATAVQALAFLAVLCAFILRDRRWLFLLLLAAMASQVHVPLPGSRRLAEMRGFFGALRVETRQDPELGPVHALYHGTTLHGAQAWEARRRCTPLSYYAPATPIGQAFSFVQARRAAARIGVVGQGAGAVSAYVRSGDSLRFFEIDPLVARVAADPRLFTYVSGCARAPVEVKLGDARLTLKAEPAGGYDLLLIDAFSSDSVPTHLLTVEAIGTYLDRLSPQGVLVLHLSNRHLELQRAAAATVRAAGAEALLQNYIKPPGAGAAVNSSDVLVTARSREVLQALAADPRWRRAPADAGRPWTDDYVNVLGALIEGAR